MADQNVNLGTIFSGKVSGAFSKATIDIKKALKGIVVVQEKVSKSSEKTTKSTKKQTKAHDELTKHIKSQGKAYRKLTSQTQEQTKSYKDLTTRAIRVVAVYGSLAMIMSTITSAFVGGLTAITDYDQALKNLQAITGATDSQVEGLGSTMRSVAENTKYSISEVAEGMILLGQAGFNAQEAMQGMEAVAVLATGTLSDMQTSTDLLTTAIRAFNLKTTDSMRVADIFASAVNKSKLTIDKLRTAFNYLGPVSHKAGLSLEETTSATMVLANAGLRASTIGTGLRQTIARLVAPSAKLRAAYHAQGIDLERLNPLTNDFADIIGELVQIVPTAEKAFTLFGLRGAAAVSALTDAGREGFEKMMREVHRSGVAFEMAEKQMEGLGVKTKNLKDRMGTLAVAIGSGGVTAALVQLIEALRNVVGGITEFLNTPVGRLTTWTILVTILTAALGALVIGIKFVAAAIVGFLVVNAAVIGSVGLVVVAIMALVTSYNILNKNIAASLKQHRELYMSYKNLEEVVSKYTENKAKENRTSLESIRLDKDLLRTMERLVEENGELSDAAQGVVDSFDDVNRSTEQTIIALTKFEEIRLKEQFKELGEIGRDLHTNFMDAKISADMLPGLFDQIGMSLKFLGGDYKVFSKRTKEANKEIKKTTRAIKIQSRELIDSLLATNRIDLFDSIDEFKKLAKAMGLPNDVLRNMLPHMQVTLDKMQKIAREGASRHNDEILKAFNPELVTRKAKEVVTATERQWNDLVKKTKNLTESQLGIFKKYWDESSSDTRSNLSGLVVQYDRYYKDIESRGLKHSDLLKAQAGLHSEMVVEAEKIKAKEVSIARAAQYKEQKEDLKEELEHELILIEASYDQRLSIVEKGSKEEQNLISKLAVDKVKAIEKSYNSQLSSAKMYYNDMMLLAGDNVEKQEKALSELLSTEKGLTDQRISTYRSMYDNFVSLAQAGTEKEKGIRKALIEIEKEISKEREKYAKQIYNYEIDLVDKVNAIKKKGLTGVVKERFIENEAINKLNVGYKNLENAIKNKDSVALHGAKKLLEQSSSIFGGLKDQKLAIFGVTKANEGLRRIEEVNHNKRLAELATEKKEKQMQLELVKLQMKTYKMLYEVLAKIINKAAGSVGVLKKELEIAPDTSKTVNAVKNIETELDNLKKKSGIKIEVDDNFVQVTDAATTAKESINEFDKALEKKPSTNAITTVGEDINKVKEEVQELHKTIDEPKIMDVNVEVEMNEVTVAVDYLNGLVTKSLHIPVANITRAVEVINELTKTTHSTHVVHVVEVQGKKEGGIIRHFAEGGWNRVRGLLGGYGGGDKNKALLEDGEFVFRKEVVKAIGPAVLNSWNNMNFAGIGDAVSGALSGATNIAKMATGGMVGNQTQEERMYNFNLNLGDTSLKGKATSSTLDAFQKDLRRLELSRGLG